MLSFNDVHRIVLEGAWDSLVGEAEGDYLECKAAPYELSSDVGRFELAKDVCSFANAGGGYIFIGIRTRKGATQHGDIVQAVRFIPQGLFDPGQ